MSFLLTGRQHKSDEGHSWKSKVVSKQSRYFIMKGKLSLTWGMHTSVWPPDLDSSANTLAARAESGKSPTLAEPSEGLSLCVEVRLQQHQSIHLLKIPSPGKLWPRGMPDPEKPVPGKQARHCRRQALRYKRYPSLLFNVKDGYSLKAVTARNSAPL